METIRPEVTGKGARIAQAMTPEPHTRGPSDDQAFSIREFCQRWHMSEATYYRLQRQDKGPAVMRLGRKKVLISREAERAWCRAREDEAAT